MRLVAPRSVREPSGSALGSVQLRIDPPTPATWAFLDNSLGAVYQAGRPSLGGDVLGKYRQLFPQEHSVSFLLSLRRFDAAPHHGLLLFHLSDLQVVAVYAH